MMRAHANQLQMRAVNRMKIRCRKTEPGKGSAQMQDRITPRQQEVLQLLAAGRSNQEIAIALGLSPATIKTHVAQAMATIGAANCAEAAARAIQMGII